MPVQSCETENRPGFRWGETGRCYSYDPDSEASKAAAREKAERQGRAVKARQNQQAEEGVPTYAMVALIPIPEDAEVLAVEGGEPPDILHITLVYLGPKATVELDRVAVEEAVRRAVEFFGPISGIFNGMCRFGPEGEGRVPDQAGQTPVVTTFDGPGLGTLREAIRASLREAVDYPEDTHDFCPHTTVQYVPSGEEVIVPEPSMLEATFADVFVCWGDYITHPENLTRIPLGAVAIEEEEAMAARKTRSTGKGRSPRAVLQAEGEMPDPDPSNGEWEACLIIEGRRTDDSRIPEGITWREPPLALMWTDETSEEHGGARRVGTITDVWQEGDCWRARGIYIGGEEAAEFKARVARGEAGWPSADIFDVVSVIEEDEEGFAVERMVSGTAAGATVVPMQAQEGTWIRPLVPAVSAAGGPLRPPAEWFEDPGLEELTPLTVTEEGRVYGHFAGTDCHNGLPGCVRVPEDVDYEVFNSSGGVVKSAEGAEIPVGPVTLRGGHAPLFDASGRPVDYEAAKAHYDESDAVIAYVRAGPSKRRFDGRIVPWVAGVLRPGVSDEQVHTFRALGVSGDWRPYKGRLSLNAVLSVPRPGFPIPRVLVASGHVEALITYSPETEEKEEEMDKETFAALHAEAHAEERKSRLAASHPKAGEAFAAFQQGNVQALIDFYCGEAGIPWGSEGEMTACMEIAEGNVDDPAALCNWMSQQCGGRFASGGPNGQVQELLLSELDRRVGKKA